MIWNKGERVGIRGFWVIAIVAGLFGCEAEQTPPFPPIDAAVQPDLGDDTAADAALLEPGPPLPPVPCETNLDCLMRDDGLPTCVEGTCFARPEGAYWAIDVEAQSAVGLLVDSALESQMRSGMTAISVGIVGQRASGDGVDIWTAGTGAWGPDGLSVPNVMTERTYLWNAQPCDERPDLLCGDIEFEPPWYVWFLEEDAESWACGLQPFLRIDRGWMRIGLGQHLVLEGYLIPSLVVDESSQWDALPITYAELASQAPLDSDVYHVDGVADAWAVRALLTLNSLAEVRTYDPESCTTNSDARAGP